MNEFTVTHRHQDPPYWEVTHTDGRWWSVARTGDADYLITNTKGRVLEAAGSTGQKIMGAVQASERHRVDRLHRLMTQ